MIANIVTIFRTLLTLPLFLVLAFGDGEMRWLALALFLGAGLLDVVDGKLARGLGQTSKFGAMIDLLGDRLLTLSAVLGLIAGGFLIGWPLIAGVVLVVRCIIVAGLNEALPGRLDIKSSSIEKLKITFSFLGLSLLMAPLFMPGIGGVSQRDIGDGALITAAGLTLVTLTDYWSRAMRAFREK